MRPAPKVSFCEGCSIPLIGGCRRCLGCHDRQVAGTLRSDEDAALPQVEFPLDRTSSIWRVLVAWFFVAEFLVVGAMLLILAGRGCL